MMRPFVWQKRVPLWACCVWIVLLVMYFGWLGAYTATPGQAVQPPRQWPKASQLPISPSRAILLVFLNPYCACSFATLEELDRLLAKTGELEEQTTMIAMFEPLGLKPEQVRQTALWERASRIAGLQLRIDSSSQQTLKRFKLSTSGTVLFYDTRQQLRYSGGLTPYRGHGGHTEGQDELLRLLLGSNNSSVQQAAVFGCALQNPKI